MDILLSICIVVYKRYSDALKLISAIEEYTNFDVKKVLYVVDNSPEKTKGRLSFIDNLKEFSDVEYVFTNGNLGFGGGHNFILSKINSKYHAILNPDIVLSEDVFSTIIDYMNTKPDVGMVIPKITDENGHIQHVYRKEVTVLDMFIRVFCKRLFPKRVADHTLQDMDYTKPFPVPFGQGSFLVIRSNIFKKLGGFDDRFFMYMEDADLSKRVNQVSKLMYIPYATVVHKWERGSHKNIQLMIYHMKSMYYYFKKWRNR